MIRAFQNDQRIATAVKLTKGGILQVYPTKESFETEEDWKAKYQGSDFKESDRKQSNEKRRHTWLENHLSQFLQKDVESDSPMQKLVRQFYFQCGIPDSIRSTTNTDTIHYFDTVRNNPRLHVFFPQLGKITPVYFNRKSGRVYIDGKDARSMSTLGLCFFLSGQFEYNMELVQPLEQIRFPEKKVVIYCTAYWRNKEDKVRIAMLLNAGYYVQFYYNNRNPTSETVDAMYAIPNVMAVMATNHDSYESVSVFKQKTWFPSTIGLSKWIALTK